MLSYVAVFKDWIKFGAWLQCILELTIFAPYEETSVDREIVLIWKWDIIERYIFNKKMPDSSDARWERPDCELWMLIFK
jgi:hypothetical protein